MKISRAMFLRGGLGASLVLPALSGAAAAGPDADSFQSGAAIGGPRPWTAAPSASGAALRFAVIGDNTGVARPGVFDQAMRQISWLRPDFVLSVGDLIEGYTGDRAEIARQWDAVEASIAKVGCPFVFTPGNHDVDNVETLEAWRERRGPGYYSFVYKGALFVILNSEDTAKPNPTPKWSAAFYESVREMQAHPDRAEREVEARIAATGPTLYPDVCSISGKQLDFVRDALQRRPRPSWTFVVIHRPAWKTLDPTFAKVQAMLAGRPHTVFAGHTHYFTHQVFDGADYINMATTGGIRTRNGPGTMDHLILVSLTNTGPAYANIRLGGLMNDLGESGQIRAY